MLLGRGRILPPLADALAGTRGWRPQQSGRPIPRSPTLTDLRTLFRRERSFIVLVGAVAVLRFLLPPGRWPGAVETWLTIFALWLLGWMLVATRSEPARAGELSGPIGVQNLAIQMLIAVPGILVGTGRMLATMEGAPPASYPANALTTLIVLPLASLTVLTFAALPLAIAVHALVRRLRGPASGATV
jgi:hypothetical protein